MKTTNQTFSNGRKFLGENLTLSYFKGYLNSKLFYHSFLFIAVSFVVLLSGEEVTAQFRAAVVKEDITPTNSQYLLGYNERQSDGVLDHIYHRIAVLDDGKTQFFIISTDLCLYSPSEYDKVTSRLKKQYGINPMNVWWSTTHTHSAPEVGEFSMYGIYLGNRIKHELDKEYSKMAEDKLVEGILEARKRLEPAKINVGWGYSNANINRRAIDTANRSTIGLNPDLAVDRRIGLLQVNKADGSPLFLIANYPMHGTVLGPQNLKISGDAPGVVSEYVEQKIGVPVLYMNGAAGNMAPIYSVYPNEKAGHLSQFKVLLGDKIVEANKKISQEVENIKLEAGSINVETPRKEGLQWPSDLKNYTTRDKATGKNMVKLPVRFLKINDDVAIWSAPIELFCEIANEVRERSPFPYTMYFGYTNGWFGYLPTAKESVRGGYEVETVSPFTPAAEGDLKKAVLNYLGNKMKK